MQIPTVSVFLNISKALGGNRVHVEGFERVLTEGLMHNRLLGLKNFVAGVFLSQFVFYSGLQEKQQCGVNPGTLHGLADGGEGSQHAHHLMWGREHSRSLAEERVRNFLMSPNSTRASELCSQGTLFSKKKKKTNLFMQVFKCFPMRFKKNFF